MHKFRPTQSGRARVLNKRRHDTESKMFHDLIHSETCTLRHVWREFRLICTRRVIVYRINNYSFESIDRVTFFPGGWQAYAARRITNNNNNSYGNGISVGEWNALDLIVTQKKKKLHPKRRISHRKSRAFVIGAAAAHVLFVYRYNIPNPKRCAAMKTRRIRPLRYVGNLTPFVLFHNNNI